MKKNHKTYLLLTAVLGIWGIIAFKVFGVVNSTANDLGPIASNEIFVPKQVKERDTFSIMADYRDPFLGTVQAPKKVQKQRIKKEPKPVLPTKNIQYSGIITDKKSKQKIFFISIDGQQQMMSINDTFQGVKLVSGATNTIKVRYDGITKTIALSK